MNDSFINKIAALDKEIKGYVINNNVKDEAIIRRIENEYEFVVASEINLAQTINKFDFYSNEINLKIEVLITKNTTDVKSFKNTVRRISKGIVFDFFDFEFKRDSSYKSKIYYKIEDSHFLRYTFGDKPSIKLEINKVEILLSYTNEHLIIESINEVENHILTEICYNLMLSIGFVTGHFVQTETHRFHYDSKLNKSLIQYRKQRNSCISMYHALTTNPYGYKYLIGRGYATELYENNTLIPFDNLSMSKLTELIHNNDQIQYALVLFNEANTNGLSLLIRNNCFYVVLEVLKKFFYDIFKDSLPKDYSKLGNIKKYKAVFDKIYPITEGELNTIGKRNQFLHGDIKDLEGDEMSDLNHKQLTLIYKIVLSFIGYDGYIINHYEIRNHNSEKAFIKLN